MSEEEDLLEILIKCLSNDLYLVGEGKIVVGIHFFKPKMVDVYLRKPFPLHEAKLLTVYSDSYRGEGIYKALCPTQQPLNKYRQEYSIPWKVPETVCYDNVCGMKDLLHLSRRTDKDCLQSTYRDRFSYKFNTFKTPSSALMLGKQTVCSIISNDPEKMQSSASEKETETSLRLHPLKFDFPQLLHSQRSASPNRIDYFYERHWPKDPFEAPMKQDLPTSPPKPVSESCSEPSWNRFPVSGCVEPTPIIPPPLRAPETNPCHCPCSCCTRLDGKGRCYCAVPCKRSTYKNVPFPPEVEFNYLQGNYKCPCLLDDCLIDHCKPPSQAALREEYDHKRRIPRRPLEFGVGCEHKCRHQCLIATQRSLPLPPHLQNVAKTYSPIFRKGKHLDEAADERIQAALRLKLKPQQPILDDSTTSKEITEFVQPRLHYGLTKCLIPSREYQQTIQDCPV